MTLTKNTDQAGSALALLLEQYKGLPKFAALLNSYTAEIQKLEDALWQLYSEVDIDTAVGVQLDGLGEIIGLDREGRSDDQYRIFLKARILSNRASGLIEEILSVLTTIVGSTSTFELQERFPAAIIIDYNDVFLPDTMASFSNASFSNASANRYLTYPSSIAASVPQFVTWIIDVLNETRAAGVGLGFTWGYRADSETFTLSSQSGVIETSSDLGCANALQTTGGHLRGVI
jgi:hypothetical protein